VAEAPVEALEWIQAAEGGGSTPQVYRVVTDWKVGVKFVENPQGARVLVN
jgi:hypothetical protein